ncbi:MAG: ABC transporter permease DevC [Cyanobacteriota bacterium]
MFPKTPVAWLQLSREKIRLMVAIAGITFADVLMFMQLGFQDALYDVNTSIHRSLQADLILISPQTKSISYMESFSRRRLYQSLAFEGVKSASSLYINKTSWQNPQNHQNYAILMLGFDPKKLVINLPDVNYNVDKLKSPDVVLFDRASRPEFGNATITEKFEQGKIVTTEVNKRRVKVGALFTVGPSFSADGNLIVSDLTFLRIDRNRNPEEIDVGLITIKPGADAQKVQASLEAYLPKDVKVVTRQGFVDLETEYWANSTPIGFIFGLGVTMGFVVGAVIVYQVLYTDVSDHLAEYATLKAIGYSDIYLLSIVFQEALILAVLGYIPGAVICLGLYDLTKSATFLPLVMTVARATIVLVLTVLMCLIAGAIAMRKLQDADPADIF